jgi:tetratricopeptide (TPR) repeat protein
MNIGDKYVLKALDNYPYYLEETLESLSYALSYEETNTMALCLMGRMYAEQLYNFEKAKGYFVEALAYNLYAVEIYPHYINLLIQIEDYEAARKTIDFALKIRGINKSAILYSKIRLYEKLEKYKLALRTLKLLNQITTPQELDVDLAAMGLRLKNKIKKNRKK